MMSTGSESWLAIQVRARTEERVGMALQNKGYEQYVPTYSRPDKRVRPSRKRSALFPGYVFCRTSYHTNGQIITTPGVIRIVSFGNKAAEISAEEMLNLQKFVGSGVVAEPWQFLCTGDHVVIENGPLRGVAGILIRHRGRSRIVISVNLLMRSISAELDSCSVAGMRMRGQFALPHGERQGDPPSIQAA